MNKENEIDSLLEKIIFDKEKAINELLCIFNNTDDYAVGNKIVLFLVDNFKDKNIESCLVNLILSKKWENYKATIWYALQEYSDGQKFLKLLLEAILENDNEQNGEVFMHTYSMIIDIKPPMSINSINWALYRIKKERKKENNKFKQQILNSLELFFIGQRDIRKFYKQFKPIEDIDYETKNN